MFIVLNPNDSRPLYLQIVDEVRRALVVGVLTADALLPSVRELAADLRINPKTVAQAYAELEREGLTYVKRGEGTFTRHQSSNGREHRALASAVAQRALQDAHRHGLTVEELMTAIHRAAAEHEKKTSL